MNKIKSKTTVYLSKNICIIIIIVLALSTILFSGSGSAEELALPTTSNPRLMEIDFEGPVFEDPGYLVKDHSLIKDGNGLFHLFYIRGNAKSFGHATSTDLIHWTIQKPVIDTELATWDSYYVWAPHVVRYDEFPTLYIMYYTGVTRDYTQRTYLAYSNDLFIWQKFPAEVFEPLQGDTSWVTWEENEWANYRDPFFFTDNGTSYLLQSVETTQDNGAIAIASSNNYFQWEDTGPLYSHDNWHMIESSNLIKHEDKYYLFFTEENIGGISCISSDSLTNGWDITTRLIIDSGHACELTQTNTDKYIFSRHSGYTTPAGDKLYTIRFDTLSWNGSYPEIGEDIILNSKWTTLWGTAFEKQPVYGNSYKYRGDDTTKVGFEGNWWIGTYENFNGPVYGDFPGSIQGDSPKGAIKSDNFFVKGRSLRLLVGGGNYPDSCYVALCDAENDTIIYKETGKNSETMDERLWDLDPWRAKNVYLKIVDNSSSAFGHINVDGIKELGRPIPTIPDPSTNEPAPKGVHPRIEGSRNLDHNQGQPIYSTSINNYPNPFNPSTTIIISGEPDRNSTVTIYSVAGRKLRSIPIRTNSTGKAQIRWNGHDGKGNALSTGVYTAVLRNDSKVIASTKLVLIK
ncbi:family 43 glycosylhydrolase [bacterium]|nr:family 43 glycosylhydrolase [bacterium]